MFTKTYKALLKGVMVVMTGFGFAIAIYAAKPTWIPSDLATVTPHYANVTDGKIEYYRFGHGTPIVLINGYGSTISSWDKRMLSALASSHEVIVFDNRNTGGTLIHSASYTSQDLANDAYQLIKQLNLSKPTVIGISMGGMIAQQLAVLHPDVVNKLILINTAIAGDISVPPSEQVKAIMFSPPHGKMGLYLKALRLFFPPSWRLRMAFVLLHEHFQPAHYPELPTNPATIVEQQRLVLNWAKDNATEQQIAHLPMPTLILNGGEDGVIPPINSEILARTIPHAKLLRWAEGGHSMIFQFPYPIAATINRFVGE